MGTHRVCSIEDCYSRAFGHGFCNMHYKRWRKHGDPNERTVVHGQHEFCTVSDCTRPHQAKGLCRSHYARYKASGEWPTTPIRPISRQKAPPGPCARPGCSGTHRGTGYCHKHYARLKAMLGYGATGWEHFDALWTSQSGQCAICHTPLDEDSCHVDHDHTQSFVRGILCPRCNHGLGHFKDRPDMLISAARYLERATL